jgi:Zn-dependent protease with chaperone function
MRFLKAFIFSSLAPLLVGVFAYWRLSETGGLTLANGLLTRPFTWLAEGGKWEAALSGDVAARFSVLILACCALLAVSALLLVVFLLASLAVGKNRMALAVVFPVLSFFGLWSAVALVLTDVGLLFGLVWAEAPANQQLLSWSSPSIGSAVIALIGIVTLLGLLRAVFSMFHIPPILMLGVKAAAPDQGRLLALVDEVAAKVGAKSPDNVVLGLELNFFATHAPMRLLDGEKMRGQSTLYLSMPALRVLSEGELRAVVGHELGHFSGNDTRYTMWFAPAMRGLHIATMATRQPLFSLIATTGENRGKPSFVLPNLLGQAAAARLDYLAFLFGRNQAAVSRVREFAADQKGADASTPLDLASALVKMYILSYVWSFQEKLNIGRLLKGRVMRNLSLSFADRIRHDVETMGAAEMAQDALLSDVAHPTDQHPRTQDRIRALNVAQRDVASKSAIRDRLYPAKPAATTLDDMIIPEEHLTRITQFNWMRLGARPAENDTSHEEINFINNIFSQLFAHMVLADHNADPREIDAAEAHARQLLGEDFDRDEFREFCRDENALAPFDSLIDVANKYLTDSGKVKLMELLDAVAKADMFVVKEEIEILERVRAALKFEDGKPPATT